MSEEDKEKETSLWYGILNAALKIPGARVDRKEFLTKGLSGCSKDEIAKVLEIGPGKAGVPLEALDKAADGEIRNHTGIVTGTSFLAGLPGGLAMAGTIPADIAQYYWHVIVIAQKLAYIYGWPDLQGEDNDDFLAVLTVFIGIMSGAQEAQGVIKSMSENLSKEPNKALSNTVLTRVGLPQIARQVARVLGAHLAKQGLAKGLGKIIPLIGGAISGAVTIATYLPMANTLKNVLREDIIK
ncbi:MAG: EcsC family protein [Treponema sp.]|nr:EcsC family protein [Treponema sp.]